MQVYQEITLLPSEEIPCHFLWEKVYLQIHLAIAENKLQKKISTENGTQLLEYSEYGVSFPQYDANLNALGCKLRIFTADKQKLKKLDLSRWLDRLQDYCLCAKIEPVPQEVSHVRFIRRQFNSNIERMARRRAKRKQETYEQALEYYSNYQVQTTRLPYIYLNSLSHKRNFPLYIEKQIVEKEERGDFSTYGLSKTATVPWF